MWQRELWEVFSGEEASYAYMVRAECVCLLVGRPKRYPHDAFGRPIFMRYGAPVGDGRFVSMGELWIMSRVKGKTEALDSVKKVGGTYEKTSWVNVGLDESAAVQCEKLADDVEALATGFINLVGLGLDVSLKKGEKGEYMACLFGPGTDGKRLGLSSWGGTYADAIAGLLIKFHVVLDSSLEGLSGKTEPSRFR